MPFCAACLRAFMLSRENSESFLPPHAESAVSLAGLASQLKPSLPTLALGNVTNAPRSQRLHVWTLNDALTQFWHRFNQRSDEIELGL